MVQRRLSLSDKCMLLSLLTSDDLFNNQLWYSLIRIEIRKVAARAMNIFFFDINGLN
jgi:hypothetical protein